MYTHVFEDEESNGDVFERLRKQGCQVLQQCCPIFWQHHYYESANTRKFKKYYTHVFEDEESIGDIFECLPKQGCQIL